MRPKKEGTFDEVWDKVRDKVWLEVESLKCANLSRAQRLFLSWRLLGPVSQF